jgi:predicted TIM-barrel fold metal-dependent hydrolase
MENAEKHDLLVSLSMCSLYSRIPSLPYFSPNHLLEIAEESMESYRITMVLSGPRLVENAQGLIRLMRRFDTLYMDTAGIGCIVFRDGELTRRLKQSVGVDRLLFGSEDPLRSRELECISNSDYLTKGDKEMILLENALDIMEHWKMEDL